MRFWALLVLLGPELNTLPGSSALAFRVTVDAAGQVFPLQSEVLLQKGQRMSRTVPWPAPAPPASSALKPNERPKTNWPVDNADNEDYWANAPVQTPAPAPYRNAKGVTQPVQEPAQEPINRGNNFASDLVLDRICVPPADLPAALRESKEAVLRGLPPWPHQAGAPKEIDSPKLAYLIQVSFQEKVPLVIRVFRKIYSPQDFFLYSVDVKHMSPGVLQSALPSPLPSNVVVRRARHAGYFYWPRVQVVLDAMAKLLEKDWDFIVHLSESDYPVHSSAWLRSTLSKQRQSNFMQLYPRCTAESPKPPPAGEGWFWWRRTAAIASCESEFMPFEVPPVTYPLEELESRGLIFARAPEWMILTREVVEYAVSPQLNHFKRLIGMHSAADEIFWATLLLNIPQFTQEVGEQIWYIYWDPSGVSHSPETLTMKHLKTITDDRRRYLFMRKVSEHERSSRSLLERMDRLMEEPDDVPEPVHTRWKEDSVACRADDGTFQEDSPQPAENPDCGSPLCK